VLHERYAGVPRIALTATADGLTRADIVEHLQLEEARQFVSSFDRPNIRYTIVEKKDATQQLLRFIEREHAGEAGIVYCQSRKRVEDIAACCASEGMDALPYHAGLDAAVRQRHQDRFLREDGVVMTRPSPSAWASTSPTCASSPTSTCRRTSRATTRRPAAPAATACRRTPGWPTACRTW
jgi:superfamily II DNA helicase RecQ